MSNANIWVIVAAFNEAAVVARTVRALRVVCPDVVVVDDGSEDRTGEEARAAGAIVVRHPINLGQGAALQTGVEYALGRDAAYLATFDADGQHDPADLARMLQTLQDRKLDIVLGSRFLGRADGLPLLRRVALRMAVLLTWVTTGVRLTDAHNGLRVMTGHTARRLRILQNRMAHASEVVAQIGRLQLRFAEVPVTIRYTTYSLRKGQKLSNGFRILTDLMAGWLLRS